MREIFGKSLALNRDLKKGDNKFSGFRRKKPAGKGIPANDYNKILGMKLKQSKSQWEFINYSDLLWKRKFVSLLQVEQTWRVKCLMTTIAKHENLELQLILGASTLLERFGKAINCIKADGFKPNKSIYYVVEGENLSTQAKSTGLGIIELASAFEELEPDAVITVADRYETMATAIAATYMNIKLIHLQGGEEREYYNRVRHSITQLADYHFACSELAARVSEMRQSNKNVFNFGCPAIDILTTQDLSINNRIMEKYSGTGHKMNWEEPYMLIVQHPVTTSYGMGFNQMIQTLNALLGIKDLQKVVLAKYWCGEWWCVESYKSF